ncbi:hypothetical protein OG453_32935 [Streptomyces sp. NBC_01381]|uniref:hypothetical protein n=1 Tax=Streptomyces sp. NBC_01381 TaxID=2903845 RepID=UPI00224D3CA2|nr:hypothetical protein [Streptomyces sp. NBC_01381]MCX4671437.1 hypothetical protein [Streptomyces sp. NBC_01381]
MPAHSIRPAARPNEDLIPAALSGLIGGSGYWRAGTLAGFARTGDYLTGRTDQLPDQYRGWYWSRFIGRIGAVALRAGSFPVHADLREVLLAMLDVWAGTPFADPAALARMRTGTIELTDDGAYAARDERGAVLAVHGNGAKATGEHFVELRTGEADPPAPGDITAAEPVPTGGWGTPAQLQGLTTLVRANGPAPWDRDAAAALADATGLSRAAASLLLAGIPDGSYVKWRLDAEARKTLRLKQSEADAGLRELNDLQVPARLDLLAGVLPDDPEQLWRPGGQAALADRIAEAWRTQQGTRPAVSEATLAVATEHESVRMAPAAVCTVFTDPTSNAVLTRDADTRLRASSVIGHGWEGEDGFRFKELLASTCHAMPWIYAELPGGDPVREGLPKVATLLRERLAHPELLLDTRGYSLRGWTVADLAPSFPGAQEYREARTPLDHPTLDDGLTVIAEGGIDRRGARQSPGIYFRPAQYGKDERSQRLDSAVDREGSYLSLVRWLRGPECRRLEERISSGALPPGSYETDPRASAPDTVAKAAADLGLDTDAATLYLQLLALPAPTDRNIRRWNDWTPARHKAAAAPLLDASLVVTDRRPRAGRTTFLPGDWASAKKPHHPMETWKADLLGAELSHDREKVLTSPTAGPLPELFNRAWLSRPR